MNRTGTGVPGLDKLMEGGFPRGSVNLVTGNPGTGKTTFCSQFLYAGLENNESCIYITTEETQREILLAAEQYGMKLDNYKKFDIKRIPPAQKVIGEIDWILEENDYDRVVIDSLSVFEMMKDQENVRRQVRDLINKLREAELTSLLTAEVPEDRPDALSRFGVAEFVVDGVIKLDVETLGEDVQRTIQVRKMRATNIQAGEFSIQFGNSGLELSG